MDCDQSLYKNQQIGWIIPMQPNEDYDSSDAEQPIEQAQQLSDPAKFLAFCRKDKKIKVMDECNPILPHVYLKDISLHKKGPMQDKLYSKRPLYFQNIRRGNTLCEIYDDNHQPQQLFLCRRGMKKFYDLEPAYLQTNSTLSHKEKRFRNMIFGDLDQALHDGEAQFHLYSIFKENGEHCQISYISQLRMWIFASKNVAILAANQKHLEDYYQKERFYWAKLIGKQFFKILQKFSEEQLANFKREIEGKTLMGEHCGHQDHQHITKYKEVEIIFYALVSNTGLNPCDPVEACEQFLSKYELKMSQCKRVKGLSDKNKVYESMYLLLKEVAEGTMEQYGEGSVLYIVEEKGGKQRTVSMCKLKTCEYLIFRRLREMLKINTAKKGLTANTWEKYKFQVENLVGSYFKPPKDLQVYYQIANRAFREIKEVEVSQDYLRYKFAQFLSKIESESNLTARKKVTIPAIKWIIVSLPQLEGKVDKFCKQKGLNVEYMFRHQDAPTKGSVSILHMVPRLPQNLPSYYQLIVCSYSKQERAELVKSLEASSDLTKSHLISFIKSEDKAKKVELVHESILAFRKQCQKNQVAYVSCEDPNKQQAIIHILENAISQLGESHTQQQPNFHKYIVLPLVIPGSGKTTLSHIIEKTAPQNVKVQIIHSDLMRRELMEEQGTVDLDNQVTNKELYQQTKVAALAKFRQALHSQIASKPEQQDEILFLDRVISPTTLFSNLEQIATQKKDYIKVVLLTHILKPTRLGDHSYPYSVPYLLTCLKRCLERQSHQILVSKPEQIVKVVLKFYQMFQNFKEKPVQLKARELKLSYKLVQHRFTPEQDNQLVNQHLKKKIEQCLHMITPGFDAKDSQSFIELVELMYTYESHIRESGDCELDAKELIKNILE